VNCGNKHTFLIGPPVATTETTGGIHAARRATVQDLTIQAVALKGCAGILGANGGAGFTMRNLSVNAFADMEKLGVFASVIQISNAKYFLIEGCTFLHCGNNTGQKPGDQPIMQIKAASDAVIRNNLFQVGLTGWNIDQSFNVVMESNVLTGYFGNDNSRPLPNMYGG
jgi:hypothetical protein